MTANSAGQANRSMRATLAGGDTIVLFGAYDALSAKVIEQSGSPALFVSGFGVVGARYGVPDIGLRSFGDISAAVRDITAAVMIPVLVDADDGYGDVKNVVHTVRGYERIGASAVMIEDQRWPKRCGHMANKAVVPHGEFVAKIRAAAAERIDPETMIFARTDARAVHGLTDALGRAEACLHAGADALFVEAPESVDELKRIGSEFDVPLLANPLPGGVSPVLTPEEYGELGFSIVCYGITPVLTAAGAIRARIEDIQQRRFALADRDMSFGDFKDLVGMAEWEAIDERHRKTGGQPGED
ncbi:isocitrate lyase/PEP mutase family protein [Prauserella flavalba]|uniref:isocitrate lyase/PEP mutase family protein n=1 Tax=Prauserella flavalba TaxID=1477506 RepID=UPI0036EA588A